MTECGKYVYVGNPVKHKSDKPYFGAIGTLCYSQTIPWIDKEWWFYTNEDTSYHIKLKEVIDLNSYIEYATDALCCKSLLWTKDNGECFYAGLFSKLTVEKVPDSDTDESIIVWIYEHTDDDYSCVYSNNSTNYALNVIINKSDHNTTVQSIEEYLYWYLKESKQIVNKL